MFIFFPFEHLTRHMSKGLFNFSFYDSLAGVPVISILDSSPASRVFYSCSLILNLVFPPLVNLREPPNLRPFSSPPKFSFLTLPRLSPPFPCPPFLKSLSLSLTLLSASVAAFEPRSPSLSLYIPPDRISSLFRRDPSQLLPYTFLSRFFSRAAAPPYFERFSSVARCERCFFFFFFFFFFFSFLLPSVSSRASLWFPPFDTPHRVDFPLFGIWTL